MKKQTILFFGTSKFATAALSEIIKRKMNLIGVVTTPDKPAGRGLKIKESDVKILAKSNNLKIYQPESLNDLDFINTINFINPDLIIVIAFKKLPKSIWEIPKYGTFNLHASILPKYRGAAPINWAIINGEEETGLTTFFINENIDQGDILFQDKILIDKNDNFKTLHDKLMEISKKITLKTIESIFKKNIKIIKQNKLKEFKKAPKIFKKDTFINWRLDIIKIYNFIRGMSPYPGARGKLKINNNIFDLILTDVGNYNNSNKSNETKIKFKLIEKNLYLINTDGCFKINKLKIAGKKEMSGLEFNNGFLKNIKDYQLI
tara:strand:+ start:523 stop:1479 length:957 start_codon:yes stop_codon:yes gene_type:complete